MTTVRIHPDVQRELDREGPVVALETAVLTHGLPRDAAGTRPALATLDLPEDAPIHVATMKAMQRAVESEGATPAVVGVVDGDLVIGLTDDEITALADRPGAVKAARWSLAAAMTLDAGWAGTTVSATLLACSRATPRVRVFATGGIGGVHAGWTRRPDVSSDLSELAHAATCVVCAGAKSILDTEATLEALETLGVPVIGYGTSWFPRFHAVGHGRHALQMRADTPNDVARLLDAHWNTLGLDSGVLVTTPVPEAHAIDDDLLDAWVAEAEHSARPGPERTPSVLQALATLCDGADLAANVALLVNNARVAAQIARAWSGAGSGSDQR